MKATGVDAIYFAVRDVARAKAFYSQLLEVAETTMDGDHGVEYVLPDGTAFGFGKYGDEWVASGCVLFTVADVDQARTTVENAGGKLLGDVRDFPKCRALWCEDPDGNSFVMHQRK